MDDLARLRSHVEWLRGDHEQCNPWLADTISNMIAENAWLREALEREKADHRAAIARHGGKVKQLNDKIAALSRAALSAPVGE